MRAIVFDGQRALFQSQFDRPTAQEGDALIRPILVGICATDLEICRGYMGFTGVLGHEFVGVVESINGPDERGLVGKRVVGAINAVCLKCDMCKAGLSNHCRHRTVLGIAGRNGCFAEVLTLPAINLTVVPDSIDDDTAVFAEPVAAALHAAKQIHLPGRVFITVLGDGRLGLLCAQAMAQLNASVRLIGKHDSKMNLCEKWGIKHRHVDDIGRRADQDVVVDCTGHSSGLALALELVRPRGQVLLKTTVAPTGQEAVDLSPVVINEVEVIGSRCGSIPDAVQVLGKGTIDVVSLISRRFDLEEGVQALKTAGMPGMIKVLMRVGRR